MMVAGVVLARFGAKDVHVSVGLFGMAETVAGALLLVWAGRHHDELHSPATRVHSIPQVALTRLIGGLSVIFSAVALAVAVVLSLAHQALGCARRARRAPAPFLPRGPRKKVQVAFVALLLVVGLSYRCAPSLVVIVPCLWR